jgi:hypothetical protein
VSKAPTIEVSAWRTFDFHLLLLLDQLRIHLVHIAVIIIPVISKLLERREPGGIFRFLYCSPLEELFHPGQILGTTEVPAARDQREGYGIDKSKDSLVPSGSGHLPAFLIHHRLPRTPVVCSSKSDNLSLEMRLFTQQLVDFVVQIPNFIVRQPSYRTASAPYPHKHRADIPSWIFETFLEISLIISPLHFSQSFKLDTDDAIRGRLSVGAFSTPISMA